MILPNSPGYACDTLVPKCMFHSRGCDNSFDKSADHRMDRGRQEGRSDGKPAGRGRASAGDLRSGGQNRASLVALARPSATHVGLRDLVRSRPPPHQPCPDLSGTAEPAEFHLSPRSDWNGWAVRRLSTCAFRADCSKDNAIAKVAPEKPASPQRRKSNHSPTPPGMPPRRDWPSQTTRTARKTAARPPVNATGAVRPAKAFPPDPFHTAKDHP